VERVPALDGLRAIAIAMVFAYHVDKGLAPAGFWGVILFFVLSGYLITRLLCAEMDRNGGVDIRSFYLRRALRLLPALIVVCLVLLAIGTEWSKVAPTLGYYANYARIAGADVGLLTHTWSLAVEEHFYLLWPLVIAAVPARQRLRAVGLLAVAAIGWRVMAIGVMSPSWVYNATDTNAAALLAGCYLGVARPRAWRSAGWSVPALLVLMFLPVFGEEGSALLWGGFVAVALGVVAIQHAVARPSWLETPVLVWLGKISYGLYLWHYLFVRSGIPVWAAVPLTVATAAASWYLVEEPVRRWRRRLEKRSPTREPAPLARAGQSLPPVFIPHPLHASQIFGSPEFIVDFGHDGGLYPTFGPLISSPPRGSSRSDPLTADREPRTAVRGLRGRADGP
jgi:peptidoglycan/LPS O-acetylase OafA/YrhL